MEERRLVQGMTIDLALSMVASASFALTALYVAIARRHRPTWKAGVVMLLACSELTLAHALQGLSADFAARVFWYKMIYVGFTITPTAFLVLALRFAGLGRLVTRRTLLLLSVVPALTVGLVLTNELSGWMWNPASTAPIIDSLGFLSVADARLWYWVFVAYSDIAMGLGCFVLSRWLALSKGVYTWQAIVPGIAAVLALLGANLDVFHVSPFQPFVATACGLAGGSVTSALVLSSLRRRDVLSVSRGTVFSSISDGIIVVDEYDRIVDVNPAAELLIGKTTPQGIGSPLEHSWPELKSILAHETNENSQATLTRANTLHIVDLRVSAIRDWRGHVLGRVIVLRDVTDRKRAEETTRNLAKFPGENPSPVLRLNADGLILYANEASQVLLHEWQCAVGEPAPAIWREVCTRALATQARHTLDYESGGEVYAFVITPIVEFNYVNLYATNITVRTQAEEALRRSARRLEILHHIDRAMLSAQWPEAIAETALLRLRDLIPFQLGGIVLFNADEPLVLAVVPSDGPTRYYGLRLPIEPGWIADLQRGQPILIPDLSVLADQAAGLQLLKAASMQSLVSIPLLAHGQLIGTLNLVANTRGAFKPEHVDIATEVSDQIAVMLQQARLHEQVQRHADELEIRVAERTRELSVANEQLKDLDRAKDQFVSNVSHELRTPLANLKLYLSLLDRGKPEKRAEYMQTLHREQQRLDRMVEDLLDLSRLDLGVTQIQPVPAELNLLLSQLIADRTALAAKHQLLLDYQPDDALPLALIDPMMLTEVITNLVGNAINYTPAGGVIAVITAACEQAGQTWVTFTVRDNGLGISARDMPHLFERFYRGEVGRKASAPGTGLGLAISQEIAEKMGGRITVESEPGHGAAFTVWLKTAD